MKIINICQHYDAELGPTDSRVKIDSRLLCCCRVESVDHGRTSVAGQ